MACVRSMEPDMKADWPDGDDVVLLRKALLRAFALGSDVCDDVLRMEHGSTSQKYES